MSLDNHLNTLTKAWQVLFHTLPPLDAPVVVLPGDVVALADGRTGLVDSVEASPYWTEDGIQRAYVAGDGWTDWVLETDIVAVLA